MRQPGYHADSTDRPLFPVRQRAVDYLFFFLNFLSIQSETQMQEKYDNLVLTSIPRNKKVVSADRECRPDQR